MIHHRVAQGSGEWLDLRLGLPTASNFHKIVTPTGRLSTQARGYAFRLVAEKLLHEATTPLEGLEWVERGKELEPRACAAYEFENEVELAPCGFFTTDNGRIGASPDRLVSGAAAAVEIKCPAPWTHLEYWIDGFGVHYKPQVQGQLLVGEFDFVDRYSYCPEMPRQVLARSYRDEAFIAVLSAALDEFCDTKDEIFERVKASGLFAEHRRLATAVDVAYGDLGRLVPGIGEGRDA